MRGSGFVSLLLSGLLTFVLTAGAQDICGSAQNREVSGAWRRVPIDPTSQTDEVTPQLRATRQADWGDHLPPPGILVSPGGQLGGAFEIPPLDNGLWITARFEAYKVFEVPNNRGTYTEIRLRVDEVIANSSAARVLAGDLIEIGEPGGTIRRKDGTVRSDNLQLRPSPFEPTHQYLLFLTYNSETEYFQDHRRWDITSGKAVPGTSLEGSVCREGRSQLSGLSSIEAVARLKAILAGRR